MQTAIKTLKNALSVKRYIHFVTSSVVAAFLTVQIVSFGHTQSNIGLTVQMYSGLSVTGTVGKVYQVQYAYGLSETNTWYALQHFELKWNPHEFVDTTCPATERRFYRAVEVEMPSNVIVASSMVFIPPGTFIMGSPESEAERQPSPTFPGFDETQHEVTISKALWMGKYEVTQGEYLSLTGTNPSWFNGDRTNSYFPGLYGTNLSRPVDQVTWDAATNYCNLLTEQEQLAGRLPPGYAYRLPTEAEWEYSCRAGTTTAFHFGDALRSGMANFDGTKEYDASAGTIDNPSGIDLGQTTSVGSYKANAWGLYDMYGNVQEWCQDWYGAYLHEPVTDPVGPVTGSQHVLRGGRWDGYGRKCRSACRHYVIHSAREHHFGFRVVLAPIPASLP